MARNFSEFVVAWVSGCLALGEGKDCIYVRCRVARLRFLLRKAIDATMYHNKETILWTIDPDCGSLNQVSEEGNSFLRLKEIRYKPHITPKYTLHCAA